MDKLLSNAVKKQQFYTKEQIEQIASQNDDENVVTRVFEYDYGDVKPVAMNVVKPLLVFARKRFHQLKKQEPMRKDDDIRKQILKENHNLFDILATHGKLFSVLTSENTTKEMADKIWYMIYLRECEEAGLMDEKESKLKFEEMNTNDFLKRAEKGELVYKEEKN